MAKNPKPALDALLHPTTTKVGRFEVRELSFGTLALLEAIDSPLYRADAPHTLYAWVETLYALTRPGREAAAKLAQGRETFAAAAFEWAEGVSNEEGGALIRAAYAALTRFLAANPTESADEPENGDADEPAEEDGGETDPDPTRVGPTAGSPGA